MAGVAVECGRRGVALERGGNEHVWRGIGRRSTTVVGNLVAGKWTKPEEFFARWEKSPTVTADLKFRVANGATIKFTAAICTFNSEGRKWFVLQLLPAAAPGPATAPEVSAIAHAPGETKTAPDAGGVMLKQKLECALQLARSVSLDFNNALTSILGHTSLLLSKAEAGHPWRHSLMEVEKIGVSRGGDRQRTFRVQPSGKGSAARAAGEFEHGGEPLRGFFPRRAWCKNHVEDAIGAGIVLGAI